MTTDAYDVAPFVLDIAEAAIDDHHDRLRIATEPAFSACRWRSNG